MSTCSLVTTFLGSVVMLLTSPVLVFGGLILEYFYHVRSFTAVTAWFSRLPSCLYTSASLNSLSSALVMVSSVCACASSPLLVLASRLVLAAVILAACVTNSVSAYGALELRSQILQQNFLAVDISEVLNKYIEDLDFRSVWDNLQRQYFCCGTFNFNMGYADWKSVLSNNSVPDSCCHLPGPGCGANIFSGPIPPLKIYTHGCLTVIQSKLEQELTSVLVVFTVMQVTLAFIALVTLVVALCLPKKKKILQRNSDEQNNSKNKPNDNNVTQITSRMKSWGPDLYTTKVSSEV